jgi:hypothetical protein
VSTMRARRGCRTVPSGQVGYQFDIALVAEPQTNLLLVKPTLLSTMEVVVCVSLSRAGQKQTEIEFSLKEIFW